MADHREARVSQGGEGVIRRVTPEENRRLTLALLREDKSDVQQQSGWNLLRAFIQAHHDERYGVPDEDGPAQYFKTDLALYHVAGVKLHGSAPAPE